MRRLRLIRRKKAYAGREAPPASIAHYLPKGRKPSAGNRVTLLRSGEEAFPAMLDAIRSAKSHVNFETYILRADRVGEMFAEALAERARAGVTVRLLYDWLGSIALPAEYTHRLESAGLKVQAFGTPRRRLPRWSLHRRDHQKILVVDDEVGFTGGLNIGNEYAPLSDGGGGWQDLHSRIEGPAVADLTRVFWRSWVKAGGDRFPVTTEAPAGNRPGEAWVITVDNHWFRARSRMRKAWLHAIRRARRSVCIFNSYFIPDRWLRRAFYRAVERGVSVRIIVPQVSDVKAVRHASRHLYGRLLSRGVRLFEWRERMMHAKAAAIDGIWATVGSFNLDRRSFFHNLEAAVVALDPGLADSICREFDRALEHCDEVSIEAWRRRSLIDKGLDWVCYQFRAWL